MRTSMLPIARCDRVRSLRNFDPFMRPEWRYERILQLVDAVPTPRRPTRFDDDYVRAARRFILRWRAADEYTRKLMAYENPGLCFAWMIFQRIDTDPEISFMVEARLLANQSFVDIANAIHSEPEVIEWYEALFFNVSDNLRHHDWILKHILLPAADRFAEQDDEENEDNLRRFITPPVIRPHLDFTLKFFSYFGGPVLCDFMLSGFKQGMICRTQDDIGEWLDEQWYNQIRRRSTMAAGVFEVNKYNVMELFATHSRIIELHKGADGQDERRTMIERHINAMLTEIPWTVGQQAREIFEGTVVGAYDEMAAELRDEEMLLVAAGEKPLALEEVPGLVMPSGKEVKPNANPK